MSLFIIIYSFLYHSYMENCTTKATNAALLSTPIYYVLYNGASVEGNNRYIYNNNKYQKERLDMCRNGTKYSNDVVSNSIFNVYASEINKKRENLLKITNCIHNNYIREKEINEMCPKQDFIDDIKFNCSSLPSCNMKCKGPDQAFLKLKSNALSCSLERKIHQVVIVGGFTIVVYIMLNVARMLWKLFLNIHSARFLNNNKVKITFVMNVETFNIPREKILNANYGPTKWDKIKSFLLIIAIGVLFICGESLKYVFRSQFKYI